MVLETLSIEKVRISSNKRNHKKGGKMQEKKPFPKKLWVIIIIVAILLTGLGIWGYNINKKSSKETPKTNNTSESNLKWKTYQDPHGFSVEIPTSWQVAVSDTGLIKIGPSVNDKKGPTVFAQTLVFSDKKTNEQVLSEITPELTNAFPGFEITSQRNITQYNSLVCQIKYTGSEYVGSMLISNDNKNAFLSGVAAEKSEYQTYINDLVKVQSTFKYDNSLKDPGKITGVVKMTNWKDPVEGAFTIDVPEGWNTTGGIVRPYIDAWVKVVTTSGDRGVQVENMYPPLYTIPNMVLEMAGFTEGSSYNPGGAGNQAMIVRAEQNAQSYIKNLLPSQLNLQVKETKDRADLVEKAAKMPWTTQTTAAEGILTGDGKKHKVIVIEQGMETAGVGLWGVLLVHYWAPEAEMPLVEDIVNNMNNSFKVNEAWAKQEQVEVAKRVGIISQTGQEISNIISATFNYRSSSQDRIAQNWSDAILGVDRVYNPSTGSEYTVPNGSNHYWSDGYDIIGTQTSDNPAPLENFIELEIVK